jgi:hypothetical protein
MGWTFQYLYFEHFKGIDDIKNHGTAWHHGRPSRLSSFGKGGARYGNNATKKYMDEISGLAQKPLSARPNANCRSFIAIAPCTKLTCNNSYTGMQLTTVISHSA